MTVDQKIAALLAIRQRQDTIRSCINGHTTPAMLEHTANGWRTWRAPSMLLTLLRPKTEEEL